ncbi:hypothetical protein PoB_005617700 [Plakobranchus ocellatus]|uniref:Uncharacterized protein n=1 Tax=Plakobranchus ocellatus TaxID=259542 RepID=A0AAV4CEM4_9GAST|nr:hypothetical protein PoB_005617700 [Plakobranchus ocellatus]
MESGLLYIASPQQGNLRLQGLLSGRSTDGGAQTHDRRVPADRRTDSQATVPTMPPSPVNGEESRLSLVFSAYRDCKEALYPSIPITPITSFAFQY